MVNKSLFFDKSLSSLTDGFEKEIPIEIESWDRNRVLASSEFDLIEYLVDRYALDAPKLHPNKRYIQEEGETKIDVSNRPDYFVINRGVPFRVPGSYVTVAIPFEGDADLFKYHGSTYSLNPPRGLISGSNLLLSFQNVVLKPEEVKQEIANAISKIEKCLASIRSDCDAWNSRVRSIAERHLCERKQRLLDHANMVHAIGIPIKRRTNESISNSLPLKRKQRPVVLPPVPKQAFKPEPLLSNDEYNYILTVIDRLAINIERSPNTFIRMTEEQIRDMILVNLNGHYEGGATGETFNSEGKTDILIRENNRNVFIAECKIWKGKSTLLSAIDQILSYLTWRDSKTALLLFSQNQDFSNVLSKIAGNIPKHNNFKAELKKVSATQVHYLFARNDEPGMDLNMAVLAFDIPKKVK